MPTRVVIGLFAVSLLATGGPSAALAGPLDPPPGPITSTAKPLAEIEPRTPISAATTPGDADSVFKITQPGSYYLTANITGQSAKRGIEIAASGVTIDLNGFELSGVAGSLSGIQTALTLVNIEVHGGSVRNWGDHGVDLAGVVGSAAIVRDVRATANGSTGIRCPDGSLITGCVASNNGSGGIFTTFGSTVATCVAHDNTGNGITVGTGCTVAGCTAYSNSSHGIDTASTCGIVNNTCRVNGLDGINFSSSCIVLANVCVSNGQSGIGAGLHCTGLDSRIEGNNCATQDIGVDVDNSGNLILRNSCAGNTTNWDIAANNVHGPILDRTAPASPAVNGNVAPSSLGSTDANANYTY